MYILQNINNPEKFVICKYKQCEDFRHIPLNEIKKSNYRFKPTCEYKKYIGHNYKILFRGSLDLEYLDIDEKFKDKEKSHSPAMSEPKNRINFLYNLKEKYKNKK